MGHDSYICGFIKLSDIEKALEAIAQLPTSSEEDDWPFLTSSMFSYTSSPVYRTEVIHFAASYKNICESWDEWELKFEALTDHFNYEEVKILVEDDHMGDFLIIWRAPIKGRLMRRRLDFEREEDWEGYPF